MLNNNKFHRCCESKYQVLVTFWDKVLNNGPSKICGWQEVQKIDPPVNSFFKSQILKYVDFKISSSKTAW